MDGVKFELLELLPEPERLRELQKLKMLTYQPGQVFHERGEMSDIYFLFSGKVRIGIDDAHGETAFFRYRIPGEMLGFYSVLSGKCQPLRAVAIEETRAGRMQGEDFLNLLLMNPPLSKCMMRILAELLVAETNHSGDILLLEASRRVAAELLRRATEKGNVFEIPGRQEMASRLGMKRETLARHLSDLQKRGILVIEIRKVKIIDLKQLADLVD
jgi:CRP/FNR family transcriptional regulator, cyclic AMP receptor protein